MAAAAAAAGLPFGPEREAEPAKEARVVGSELVDTYTVYIVRITDGSHEWTVKHRYSDFHDLHEKVTLESWGSVSQGLGAFRPNFIVQCIYFRAIQAPCL